MGIVENPVIRGFAPDPCVCRGHDGAWYLAVSTFEWYPGVHIYRSEDLGSWKLAAAPLNRLSLLDLRGEMPSAGVWAPALSYADGLYWLAYTDSKNWHGEPKIGSPLRDQYNYLATAPRVEGEWSEPVFLCGGGYDPTLFHDEDGRKYFAYARRDYRYPGEKLFSGIVLQEFSPAEGRLVGDEKAIYYGADLPIDFFVKQQIYEGPHLYKRDGWYYLATAEGGVGSTHATCVSRSRSIWGPYEPHPERRPFLSASGSSGRLRRAGHGNLFPGPGGQDYMSFLCARPLPGAAGVPESSPLGRESGIAPVEWRGGWPYLAGESSGEILPPERYAIPGPDPEPEAQDELADFSDSRGLSLEFQSLRRPVDPSWFSLSDRPGFLRLYGRDSPASRFDQSLVGRRIRHFSFEAETELEFEPESWLQFAGLMLRYDESSFLYLHIAGAEEGKGRVLAYMETLGGAYSCIRRIEVLGEGPLRLRASCRQGRISFSRAAAGGEFEELGIEKDLRLLSDEAAYPVGFTGAFAAIACSDMLRRSKPADFRYFRYRALG